MSFKLENEFVGPQLIAQSDRIIIDGGHDVVINGGIGGITIKTQQDGIHFNVTGTSEENKFLVNSNKIRLGPIINGNEPNINAVKSDQLIFLLDRLINSLKIFFDINYPQTSGLQGPNMGINNTLKQGIVNTLEAIQKDLDSIKSDTVYIR